MDKDNSKRISWAQNALDTFARETYGGPLTALCPEDTEDAISDLIADLLHLCAAKGFDYDNAIERARGHFEYEAEDGLRKTRPANGRDRFELDRDRLAIYDSVYRKTVFWGSVDTCKRIMQILHGPIKILPFHPQDNTVRLKEIQDP